MKRLLIALMLLLATGSALAFDTNKAAVRVGILRASEEYSRHGEQIVAYSVIRALEDKLRDRGIDAFDAGVAYEDRAEAPEADFYVEILGTRADSGSYGGVGIGGRHAGVTVEMLVSEVAAEVRVYDGATFETLHIELLSRSKKGILPTSIGIGGSRIFAFLTLPFAEWAQYRRATQAVARDAAGVVLSAAGAE